MGLRLADYTPECRCFCLHDECLRLAPRQWCRHWYIVQWVTTEHILSDKLEQMLRDCLQGRDFRYWGSMRVGEDHWEYCLLLCIDPKGDGLSRDEYECLDPRWNTVADVDFDCRESFVMRFRCCADFLKQDAPGWIAAILNRGGSDMLLGDEKLRFDLNTFSSQLSSRTCKT